MHYGLPVVPQSRMAVKRTRHSVPISLRRVQQSPRSCPGAFQYFSQHPSRGPVSLSYIGSASLSSGDIGGSECTKLASLLESLPSALATKKVFKSGTLLSKAGATGVSASIWSTSDFTPLRFLPYPKSLSPCLQGFQPRKTKPSRLLHHFGV